jgi:hypothetical protein
MDLLNDLSAYKGVDDKHCHIGFVYGLPFARHTKSTLITPL